MIAFASINYWPAFFTDVGRSVLLAFFFSFPIFLEGGGHMLRTVAPAVWEHYMLRNMLTGIYPNDTPNCLAKVSPTLSGRVNWGGGGGVGNLRQCYFCFGVQR